MPGVPFSLLPKENLEGLRFLASLTPKGAFVELGVYQGGSAYVLYKLAQSRKEQLHLFDTFSGMPNHGPLDVIKAGSFKETSVEQVQAAMPNAIIHEGFFPATLTEDVTDIAFLHIDCDQYQSCRDAIDLLWPRVVSGGIMAFDDYPLAGINKAIHETFRAINFSPEKIPFVIKK